MTEETGPASGDEGENLDTWEQFEERLKSLRQGCEAEAVLRPLFRGQGDSGWHLRTTLERRGRSDMTVEAYYRLVAARIKPEVESLTEHNWNVPPFPEVEKLLNDYDNFSLSLVGDGFPGYGYLIYARHHGFPSPLLDWTRSPYIAAYFAFAKEKKDVAKRSIYVWCQPKIRPGGTNKTEIHRLGPYVRAHRRHVVQQNDYTLGLFFSTADKTWRFVGQEDALRATPAGAQCLWKLNLPSTERAKVLRFLDAFNLNGFSLFGSEESLMETLAIRHIDLAT
jgi:hypothetical protein